MFMIIGLLFIVGGIAYAFIMYKKHSASALEYQFMQTSTVNDAIEIVDDIGRSDINFRHYVEIKGLVNSEQEVIAPFIERPVAYYRNKTSSVSEVEEVRRDNKGNTRRVMRKQENLIANEASSTRVFIKDNSSDKKIFIDIDGFGNDLDLIESCDRIETENSAWMRRHPNMFGGFNRSGYGSSRFIGYRLVEHVLNVNSPLYILGEIYKYGDEYHIGKAVLTKKASKVTYKSEDQLVEDTHKQKNMSLVFGGILVLIGLFMVFKGL